jgi:hypothetical protein
MRVLISGIMAGACALVASQALAAGAPNLAPGSKKLKVALVPAYAECTAPDTGVRSPLHILAPGGGCTAISRPSSAGTQDLTFDEAAKGKCEASIGVSGKPDVKLKGKCKGLLEGGVPTNDSLLVLANVRVTSSGCNAVNGNPTGGVDCTITDFPFPIAVPCAAGKCSVSTSANTLVPGAVVAGERGNIEIGQITATDNDAQTAFVQGITIP